MKQRKLNLPSKGFLCPVTNQMCWLGATLLIKPTELEQTPLKETIDYADLNEVTRQMAEEEYGMKEEAERHG